MAAFIRVLVLSLATIALLGRASMASDDDTVIVIANEQVLRIRADSGGFTASQRAEALRHRLVDIYQKALDAKVTLMPSDVTLDMTPGKPAIRVRDWLLLSITHDDARVNGSSIEDLAKAWHAKLRVAIPKGAPMPSDAQYPDEIPEPHPGSTPKP